MAKNIVLKKSSVILLLKWKTEKCKYFLKEQKLNKTHNNNEQQYTITPTNTVKQFFIAIANIYMEDSKCLNKILFILYITS